MICDPMHSRKYYCLSLMQGCVVERCGNDNALKITQPSMRSKTVIIFSTVPCPPYPRFFI